MGNNAMRMAPLDPPERGWWQVAAPKRTRLWPMLLAGLALLGLLLAFHDVVRGAVLQGEMRRAAVAARELASWRCTTLHSAPLRDDCRATLDADPARR